MQRESNSTFGHVCNGGGASINNSPVNLTINIYVGDAKPTLIDTIKQAIGGLIGKETRNIEIPAELSEHNIQRHISGAIQNK